MTTLEDLERFIEALENEARAQDITLRAFLDRMAELDPDTLLGFQADALPEIHTLRAPARQVFATSPIRA